MDRPRRYRADKGAGLGLAGLGRSALVGWWKEQPREAGAAPPAPPPTPPPCSLPLRATLAEALRGFGVSAAADDLERARGEHLAHSVRLAAVDAMKASHAPELEASTRARLKALTRALFMLEDVLGEAGTTLSVEAERIVRAELVST